MVVERTAETGEKAIVIVLCLISSTLLEEQENSDPISRLSENLSANALSAAMPSEFRYAHHTCRSMTREELLDI